MSSLTRAEEPADKSADDSGAERHPAVVASAVVDMARGCMMALDDAERVAVAIE